MTHQFDVVVEKDSAGYFVASVPALMERIQEAIELCLAEYGRPRERLDFIGVQRVTVHA
jgi:predicted RNase H-like HicB family nuclease